MSKLAKKNLVKGLPKVSYERNRLCDACQLGKQTRNTFKPKNIVSTTRSLELLHMDLFGPTRTTSLEEKRYGLVIVDDYSRFTWVMFLAHKDKTFALFQNFVKNISIEKNTTILSIRSDHGAWYKS